MTVSCGFPVVIPSGFEPETHSLEGCCSIQLSYGTKGGGFENPRAKVLFFLRSTKFFAEKVVIMI